MHPPPSMVPPVAPAQFQGNFGGSGSNLISPSTDSGVFTSSPAEPWRGQPAGHHPRVEDVGAFPEANKTPWRDSVVEDAEAQYPYSDEDASMPDSDDAVEDVMIEDSAYGQLVYSRNDGPWDVYGTKMRSFSAFADETILTSYIPTPNLSPLNDERTAALFWHFVNVTAPSMSLYERHPFDHSKLSNNQTVPKAGHNIWTCKIGTLLVLRLD